MQINVQITATELGEIGVSPQVLHDGLVRVLEGGIDLEDDGRLYPSRVQVTVCVEDGAAQQQDLHQAIIDAGANFASAYEFNGQIDPATYTLTLAQIDDLVATRLAAMAEADSMIGFV